MEKTAYKNHLYSFDGYDSLLEASESVLFETVYTLLDYTSKDIILDVGCGRGAFRKRYPNITNYTGVDLSLPNLLDTVSPFGKFVNMNAAKMGFKDNTFSKTICCEVLEHVEEQLRIEILNEIVRVTKLEGIIVLTVPNALYLWSYLPWSFKPIKRRSTFKDLITSFKVGHYDERHPHYSPHYRFIPTYFSSFLNMCGLKVVQLKTTYWYNNRYIKYIPKNIQNILWKYLVGWKLGSQIVVLCKPVSRETEQWK